MRFDTKVIFVKLINQGYGKQPVEERKEVYCNVTDLTAQKSVEVFGEFLTNGKAIRLQQSIDFNFDYLLIDNVKYVLSSTTKPLQRQTVFVRKSVKNEH